MATIALKTLPEFIGLSAQQYASLATKKSNALYFVYDAGVNGIIYRGTQAYGETIKYVTEVPAAENAVLGVVYFNTNSGVAYVKAGSTLTPIGVISRDTIDDSTTTYDSEVPNIGAVKKYIKKKVATVFTYKGVVDTVSELPTFASSATTDTVAAANKTYYTRTGTSPNYVYERLDLGTGEAIPTGGTVVEGPKVGDLYNVVQGEDGTSAEYAWTEKEEGTAPSTHHVYVFEKLGTTIDYSIFMQKVTGATSGNLAVYGQDGQVVDSSVAYSVATTLPTVESAASNVLVNELEVANASSAINANLVSASSALNTSISTASSALDAKITNASSALDSKVTAASSALDSKITEVGLDAIQKGSIDGTTNANEVIVVGGTTSNVSGVATGKYLGSSAFAAENANVTMATEAGVSGYVAPISSTLSASISSTSSALNSSIVAASAALSASISSTSSALDADKMDKVPKNSAGYVLISKDDGNSELTGYITGSSAIVTANASDKTLATEYAVVALMNSMAWQTVEG